MHARRRGASAPGGSAAASGASGGPAPCEFEPASQFEPPSPSEPPAPFDPAPPAAIAEPADLPAHAPVEHADQSALILDGPPEPRAFEPEPAQLEASALARLAAATRPQAHAGDADELGLDREYELKLRPFFERLCSRYLHVDVEGAESIPAHGRVLLVSNHSRCLAWDGLVLRTALRLNHPAQRQLRWLVDDAQFHAPFLGTFINRLGAVRACQDNAERLLLREELVAVFPEGAKGSDKPFRDRYRLMRFGRGGYVKLALRTGTPVIPVAIVGDEEGNPFMQKAKAVAQWRGLSMLGWTPALPRLGPLGVPPLPSRWRIRIGRPVAEIARQDADATRDEGLVHELNECVRMAVQHLIDDARSFA